MLERASSDRLPCRHGAGQVRLNYPKCSDGMYLMPVCNGGRSTPDQLRRMLGGALACRTVAACSSYLGLPVRVDGTMCRRCETGSRPTDVPTADAQHSDRHQPGRDSGEDDEGQGGELGGWQTRDVAVRGKVDHPV